jgi:hypothetical protein
MVYSTYQATERIKKVFQKELKKAMNALNSSKTLLMVPAAPSTAAALSTIQPETVLKAALPPTQPAPATAITAAAAITATTAAATAAATAVIVKKDVPPKPPAPAAAVLSAATKTLKVPPVRTASSSSSANTVTTAIQFSGYETRCDVILRALVRDYFIFIINYHELL